MTFADVLKTLIEIAAVVFTVWALFHEDRFIAFEEKLFAKIRRKRLRVIKGGAAVSLHECKQR